MAVIGDPRARGGSVVYAGFALRGRYTIDGEGRTVDELLECARRCFACAGSAWLAVSLGADGNDDHEPEELLVLTDCAELCEATARSLLRRSPQRSVICALTAELCERAAAIARADPRLEEVVLPAARCARSCRAIAEAS